MSIRDNTEALKLAGLRVPDLCGMSQHPDTVPEEA